MPSPSPLRYPVVVRGRVPRGEPHETLSSPSSSSSSLSGGRLCTSSIISLVPAIELRRCASCVALCARAYVCVVEKPIKKGEFQGIRHLPYKRTARRLSFLLFLLVPEREAPLASENEQVERTGLCDGRLGRRRGKTRKRRRRLSGSCYMRKKEGEDFHDREVWPPQVASVDGDERRAGRERRFVSISPRAVVRRRVRNSENGAGGREENFVSYTTQSAFTCC
jgi:hypothetical protein